MHILLIGNSYTYYNDMPAMLATLARENGKDVQIDAVTKGGRRLYENLAVGDEYHTRICELIAQRTYDVLILQEQSYYALVDYEAFLGGIRGLMELVGAKRTLLYSTWGRKDGCELLADYGGTCAEMTARLSAAYRAAATAVHAELSRVGDCFLEISRGDSAPELYHPDRSHPSAIGSAVAALVHYRTVFGELPQVCRVLPPEVDAAAVYAAIDRVNGETEL